MFPWKMWVSENFGPISKSRKRLWWVLKSYFQLILCLGGSIIFKSVSNFWNQPSQNYHSIPLVAGEFCIVNSEFSDLWCLMNTLQDPENALPDPVKVHAEHVINFKCSESSPWQHVFWNIVYQFTVYSLLTDTSIRWTAL